MPIFVEAKAVGNVWQSGITLCWGNGSVKVQFVWRKKHFGVLCYPKKLEIISTLVIFHTVSQGGMVI